MMGKANLIKESFFDATEDSSLAAEAYSRAREEASEMWYKYPVTWEGISDSVGASTEIVGLWGEQVAALRDPPHNTAPYTDEERGGGAKRPKAGRLPSTLQR